MLDNTVGREDSKANIGTITIGTGKVFKGREYIETPFYQQFEEERRGATVQVNLLQTLKCDWYG